MNIGHNMILIEMSGKQTHKPPERIARHLEGVMDLQSMCSRLSTLHDGTSTVDSLLKICSVLSTPAGRAQ